MAAPIDTAKWRACAPLLPDGGCEAVRMLCDEVDALRGVLRQISELKSYNDLGDARALARAALPPTPTRSEHPK